MDTISLVFFLIVHVTILNLVTGCQLIHTGLTEAEKQYIVYIHNKYREFVANGKISKQPPAENMQVMKWDKELENIAQTWANKCDYKHNSIRKVKRFSIGENIAQIRSTAQLELGDFPKQAVKLWFDEYKIYTFGQPFSSATAHYSQWIWADTNLIGCGFSYYFDKRTNYYVKYYVCNYGPAGNIDRHKAYIKGSPNCKKNKLTASTKYPGLCQKCCGVH